MQRFIYGLKQASRSWNLNFDEIVGQFKFIKNKDEPCVYKKVSSESKIIFLVSYVDHILPVKNDIPSLQHIETWLWSYFLMKDLGEESYVLGIRIYRDRLLRLVGLSESTYIDTKCLGALVCMIQRRVSCLCHMVYTYPRDNALLHQMRGNT